MEHIAIVTQDPYLLADSHGYFEACGVVRHDRRKILELIAKAINDKLSGNIQSGIENIQNRLNDLEEKMSDKPE